MFGVITGLVFLAHGIWLLNFPDFADFWELSHWLAQGTLGIFAGLAGCFLEFRGYMRKDFGEFAVNLIGTTVFYVWLGFYLLGAETTSRSREVWVNILRAAGILAWVVAVFGVPIFCTSRRLEVHEEPVKHEDPAPTPPPHSAVEPLQNNV